MYRRLSLVVLVAFATTVNARGPLEIELSDLVDEVEKALSSDTVAKQIQEVADAKKNKRPLRIRMGRFHGDGDVPTHAGSTIQRCLLQELQKRKIVIDRKARIELKGDYAPATLDPDAPNLNLMYLRVNATLVDTKTRTPLKDVRIFDRAVYGNDLLGSVIAPTLALSPGGGLRQRNTQIRKSIENPKTHVKSTLVRSSATSPFAVEVFVVDEPDAPDPKRATPIRLENGLAYFDVGKQQHYRLKVHNNAPFSVAVEVSIDGLDHFVFCDQKFRNPKNEPIYRYRIIPSGESTVVRGWFRNLKRADSFRVDEYAKSAVAELDASTGSLGQICVKFRASWEKVQDMPTDEPSSKGVGTARGKPLPRKLQLSKPIVGVVRDQVSIRYGK